MKLQVEIIDPAYAKQALEQNAGNRRITQARVEQYARDMKAGKWNENNGETLKFTSDGKLLDGQHRLLAVILSQCTVAMAVARNVPIDAFVTIDSGKTRNLSDVLSIEGHKNVNTIASMAKSVYCYIAGVSYSYTVTRATLEEVVAKSPYMAEVAAKVMNIRTFPKAPLATVLYLGTHAGKYHDEMSDFLDGLATGQGLFAGDARYTLREWYISNKNNKVKSLGTETLLFGAARAWNAFSEGASYQKMGFARGVSFTRKFVPIRGHDRKLFDFIPDLGAK